MKINVHIERLILEGLPVTTLQGPQVQSALEKELGRLLATHGFSTELRSGIGVPELRAPAVQLGQKHDPHQLGRDIARSVYGGIGKPR